VKKHKQRRSELTVDQMAQIMDFMTTFALGAMVKARVKARMKKKEVKK